MEYAYKEYYLGALTMSVIACIGSLLSVVNLIPLLITYQLIQKPVTVDFHILRIKFYPQSFRQLSC